MMMSISRRQFLKGMAGVSALSVTNIFSRMAFADIKHKGGDLTSCLQLLNYGYGGTLEDEDTTQVPTLVKDLYTNAYNVLDVSKSKTFVDVAADSVIQTLCDNNGIVHLGGPMLGDLTSTGVKVWVRTFRPAAVKVRVTTPAGDVDFGPVNSTTATDHVAIVPVTGLDPSTSYPYSVLVDDTPITIPNGAAITTAPQQGQAGITRIAFGTCPHRWGLGRQDLWERISSRNPAVMLLGGDIAVQDRENNIAMHRADVLVRDLQPPWKDFAASIPVYATWDDHDYFNNDKAGIPSGYTDTDRQNVCSVFRSSWNNPSYGASKGVYFRTRIGPCDVIMVDNRYFRYQSGDTHPFLGDEQMDWLEEQLLACTAPFIILSCGTMWSDYVSGGKDSWGTKDPAGRERIFNFIEENNIKGVLLISGDRHGARGFRIPRPSGYEYYEFEPASLGKRSGPPVTDSSWTTQLYGYANKYAFGEFEFDTTKSDPEVTFRLTEEDNAELYSITLKRSQLTPKRPKADINGDGKVDVVDLRIMANEWLNDYSATGAVKRP
jgi:alkaline phosphatase D